MLNGRDLLGAASVFISLRTPLAPVFSPFEFGETSKQVLLQFSRGCCIISISDTRKSRVGSALGSHLAHEKQEN